MKYEKEKQKRNHKNRKVRQKIGTTYVDKQKEINKTKNQGLPEIVTVTGKRTYPKTETVNVALTSANTGG